MGCFADREPAGGSLAVRTEVHMIYRALLTAICVAALAACQARTLAPSQLPAGGSSSSGMALHDQDVPLKGTLTGTVSHDYSNPRQCASGRTGMLEMTGNSSHMGLVTFHAEQCMAATGVVQGDFVQIAANGDELRGSYVLIPIAPPVLGEWFTFNGTLTFSAGTGRFAEATGTGTISSRVLFEGYQDPSWPGECTFEGRISY